MRGRELISVVAVVISVVTILTVSVSAHVVVRPSEVLTADFQTFTVGAPNEKETVFNEVKLEIPSGLMHVSVNTKPGWEVDIEREGSGDEATVKSITWSGGSVPSGFREDFGFSAQVPAEETELQWKAYQTYDDGTTVSWNLTEKEQPKNKDGSPDFSKSGPFSVTKVAAQTETEAIAGDIEKAASDAKGSADRAFYIGIAAVVVSLVSLYFATKKSEP